MTRPVPPPSARRRSRRRVTFGLVALVLLLGAVTSGLILAGIAAAWWGVAVQGGVLLVLLASVLRREPAAEVAMAAPAPAPDVSPVRALAFRLEEPIERLRHQERQRFIAGEVSFEEWSACEEVFLAARAEMDAPEVRSPTQVSDGSARRARRWSVSEPLLVLRKGRGHQASTSEGEWSAAKERVQRLAQDYHAGLITWGQLDLGIDQVRDDVLAALCQRANLPGALERMPTSSAPVNLTRSRHPTPVTPPEARPVPGAWVHWDYSPEEWARFDAVDWRPKRRLLLSLLVGVYFGLCFALGPFLVGDTAIALLILVGLTALVGEGAYWISGRTSYDRHRLHQARTQPGQPHRVTFAKQGVWEAGEHFSFDDLADVKLTTNPPVLHFHTLLTSAKGNHNTRLRVLVPRGHEHEAAWLMQRYQDEVIEAKRLLKQRWRNPPEPR